MHKSMEGEAIAPCKAMENGVNREYEQAYCLFCRTGQEQSVAQELSSWDGIRALFPAKAKTEWRGGRWENLIKPLLPGYVFLYTREQLKRTSMYKPGGIVRMLKYADGSGILRSGDRAFADWVWKHGGFIGLSKVVDNGDRVEIADGPLKDMGGVIVAVDRRKRIAKVELDIVGSTQRIWLSFDYLQ